MKRARLSARIADSTLVELEALRVQLGTTSRAETIETLVELVSSLIRDAQRRPTKGAKAMMAPNMSTLLRFTCHVTKQPGGKPDET